jgi:hypothetical protein
MIWHRHIVVTMLPHIVLAWEFMAIDAVQLSADPKSSEEA